MSNKIRIRTPMTKEEDALAEWLSAALDDPMCCDEYKAVISAWFDSKTITINEPSEEHGRVEEAMWNALRNQPK